MTVKRTPAPPPPGFTASTTITATNASWPVPALAYPIVKVTCVGGGGSGAGGGSSANDGGAGGTSSFVSGAINVSAGGGSGGSRGNTSNASYAGTAGLSAGNGGQNKPNDGTNQSSIATSGNGGEVRIAYVDLTGISTANVTVGAGGTPPGNATAGGRGEVIVEYAAG